MHHGLHGELRASIMDKTKEYRENKAAKNLLAKLFAIEESQANAGIEKKQPM